MISQLPQWTQTFPARIPTGEYHEKVHWSNCLVSGKKTDDIPASPMDTDLPSKNTLLFFQALVVPVQSPAWLQTSPSVLSVAQGVSKAPPWILPGHGRSLGLEQFGENTHLPEYRESRDRSSPSHGHPKPLRNKQAINKEARTNLHLCPRLVSAYSTQHFPVSI